MLFERSMKRVDGMSVSKRFTKCGRHAMTEISAGRITCLIILVIVLSLTTPRILDMLGSLIGQTWLRALDAGDFLSFFGVLLGLYMTLYQVVRNEAEKIKVEQERLHSLRVKREAAQPNLFVKATPDEYGCRITVTNLGKCIRGVSYVDNFFAGRLELGESASFHIVKDACSFQDRRDTNGKLECPVIVSESSFSEGIPNPLDLFCYDQFGRLWFCPHFERDGVLVPGSMEIVDDVDDIDISLTC